jgi:thymidine phosphorylase
VDAERIGQVVLQLGAGRRLATDSVDPAAGISGLVQCGDRVERGQPLMRLHARDPVTAGALLSDALASVSIDDAPRSRAPLVLETLT